MFSFKIQMYECKHSNFMLWYFKIFCKVFFLAMGSPDGEKFSQLCLETVDVYKKWFMPQNGQVTVLKCSPMEENEKKF